MVVIDLGIDPQFYPVLILLASTAFLGYAVSQSRKPAKETEPENPIAYHVELPKAAKSGYRKVVDTEGPISTVRFNKSCRRTTC